MQNVSSYIAKGIAAILMAALFCVSCSSYRQITIESCDVRTVSPKGLKSADLTLGVKIHNPAPAFIVHEITGDIHDENGVIVTFKGGPVAVEKKCDAVYELPCNVSLGKSLSLLTVMRVAQTMDISTMKVNICADVSRKRGFHKKIEYNELPLKELVEQSGMKLNPHIKLP